MIKQRNKRIVCLDCECEECSAAIESNLDVDLCEECYSWNYCECGTNLGEYAGDGFCKRCE